MCGICGLALKEQLVDEKKLREMTDTLIHRGPDDSGLFVDRNIGLGHRRLSIIDLKGGHQPMSNEDKSVWIAYNGEVYNHAALRERLIASGHRYQTKSDTETLIHLYEEDGLEGIHQLRGMFAYSLWDARHKQVILVRDRLGIKPFYYYFDEGNLFWGSEIKALFASGYVKPRFRMQSLPDYLANRYTSAEDTLFEGIKRLLPGHVLVWKNGKIDIRQYWDIHFKEPHEPVDEAALVEEFGGLFEEAVKMRLMSDVPLGVFLSGGIDSSAIAAVMSKLVSEPIKTFSVAFKEREGNERQYARMVSQRFRTDHYEVIVTPESFFGHLPKLIWHEDEPIAFPSSVPLYFVSELARSKVKVVLTGEGSDELLAGYAKYRKTLINAAFGNVYSSVVPAAVRKLLRNATGALPRDSKFRQKLSRTFLYLEPDIESIYFDNFSVFSRQELKSLLSSNAQTMLDDVSPFAMNMEYFQKSDARNLLDRILYTDIKTYLHELLMKQDQMSMAASIESRVPFLDHKLVEFAATLPSSLKLRGAMTKYILKQSLTNVLPREILFRRKMGFPVPLKTWFQRGMFPKLREYLLGERTLSRGYFNKRYVEQLLHDHTTGIQDHSERIWSLVNFELWNRIFIDGDGVQQ